MYLTHRNDTDYYLKVIEGCNLISHLDAFAKRGEEGIPLQPSTGPSCLSSCPEGGLPSPKTLETDHV